MISRLFGKYPSCGNTTRPWMERSDFATETVEQCLTAMILVFFFFFLNIDIVWLERYGLGIRYSSLVRAGIHSRWDTGGFGSVSACKIARYH